MLGAIPTTTSVRARDSGASCHKNYDFKHGGLHRLASGNMGADFDFDSTEHPGPLGGEPLDLGALENMEATTLRAWRDACANAGFDDACIGRCERIAPRQLDPVRLPVVQHVLRQDGSAAARLAQLFAYRDSISREGLDGVLPASVVEVLERAGVLVETDRGMRSRLRFMPFQGLWILSDEMDAPGDPVMGPGATTLELARMMRCRGGDEVLDVGCGAGTLALLAARQGAKATGVDLHPRAVRLGALNARLNGLSAEFRAGDLLEPIRDRRFDLVVSQPPYVVTPPDVDATTYLHGGQRGDELAFRLVSELPGVLHPQGRALVLFDTPLDGAQLRESLPSPRAPEPPCDHLLLVSPGHDADMASIGYAAVQCPDLDSSYSVAVARYRGHLASLSIERLSHVALVMWPTARARPRLSISLRVPTLLPWSAARLDRLVEAAQLATQPVETLLQCSVSLATDCRIIEERPLGDPGAGRVIVRFLDRHFADRELTDTGLVLVDAVRREQPLFESVKRFASAVSQTPEAVQDQVLEFVRQSLVSGLLAPSTTEPPSPANPPSPR